MLICSTCFQDLISLPYFGNKIQLTEILFPFAVLFFPFSELKRIRFSKKEIIFFLLLFFYLLINVISSLNSLISASIFESFGRIYLALLFLLLIVFFTMIIQVRMNSIVSQVFFHMGWGLSLLSLSGYVLLYFNIENPFVYKFEEYPYLGTVYRLRGPTFTPSMLITILSCCLIFSVNGYKTLPFRKSIRNLLIGLIIIACLLTFSKTLILICWGLGIWLWNRHFRLSWFVILSSIIPVIAFLFITTHYVFARPGSEQYRKYIATNFVSRKVAFKIGNTDALETCYLLNKKIALELTGQNYFLGIGAGNFNNEIDKRKQEGNYPVNFLSYDPHSTYFGSLAENGIPGFIAMSGVLILILLGYIKLQSIKSDPFFQSIFALLVIFYVEAISTDIMNFRHFWVLLAIAFAYMHNKNRKVLYPD